MLFRSVRLLLCLPLVLAATAAQGAAVATPPKVLTIADAKAGKDGIKRLVMLRGLDKITGRAIDIAAPAGVPVRFGTLSITSRYCYTVPPEEPPETAAFLQIDEQAKSGDKPEHKFSGWMFASTPALNGLEHPVYDVWVITCKIDQPAKAAAGVKAPPGLPPPVNPVAAPANPPAAPSKR